MLVAARITAVDVRLVGHLLGIGGSELPSNRRELLGGFGLQPKVVQPGARAAMRDREIHARIVEHPLRVIGLLDRRRHAEEIRVETNARGQVGHAQVHMESTHHLLLLRADVGLHADGAQVVTHASRPLARQQFSVR